MAKYCEICNIDLYDDFAYQNHLTGKRHLKTVRYKEYEDRLLRRSIFLPRIPKSVSRKELIEFFEQYGTVVKYKFGARYVTIEYDKREPVDYLLKNTVWINQHKLDIQGRKLYNTPMEMEIDPIDINIIKDKFEKEPSFDSQFAKFLDSIELKDIEMEHRYNEICPALEKIFAPVFPKCRAYKFGSTLTGLKFKECDLDIYMKIDVEEKPNVTIKQIYNQMKSILYRRKDVFAKVIPILHAKTPIIKFYYVPTKVSCDISFKNAMAVYNGRLINHCLSYDIRIKPLMMLIKYWARQCKLTLCGKITNYALVLMIILYLQQPEQDILPPLTKFLEKCEPIYIDGWQANSDEIVKFPKQNTDSNNKNIPELLKGFFEFYMDFDFAKNIICPRDGLIYDKQNLNITEDLPNSMAHIIKHVNNKNRNSQLGGNVWIQDPIELNRNVACTFGEQLIDSFKRFCKIGADICKSSSEDDYKNLLITLLEPIYEEKHKIKEFKVMINAKRYLNVGLPDDFEKCTDIIHKDQYKEDNLFLITFNIVKDILEKVFLLEVEIIFSDTETKQQKIEALSDVHTKEHKQLLLRCTGNFNGFMHKKNDGTLLDPSMSALDKEAIISRKAAKKVQSKSSKNVINYVCKFEREKQPGTFQLTFTDMSERKKILMNFKHFAKNKIPKITVKTLMHMLQFKKLHHF